LVIPDPELLKVNTLMLIVKQLSYIAFLTLR
jgi:hypothetical protein